MMLFVLAVAIVIVVAAMLSPRAAHPYDLFEAIRRIGKALRGLLGDGKELALFALVELVAIGALALLLMAVGPRVGGVVLVGGVGILAVWVLLSPPKSR